MNATKERIPRCAICNRSNLGTVKVCTTCAPVQAAFDALVTQIRRAADEAERAIREAAAERLARLQLEQRITELTSQPEPSERILSQKDVESLLGVTRQTIRNMERAGRFPKRIRLGEGPQSRMGWIESEVMDWLEAIKRQNRGFVGGGQA
jgi:prophage regulatory protein